jgi:putative peptidoglycan lipid II flippase
MPQVAFFVIPSAAVLASLGQVLAGGVFQTGAFTGGDARYVWGILAGSSIGLLAGTLARLYSSAWYALHDTRTPLRCAAVRLLLGTSLGWFASLRLPLLVGVEPYWGAAGLTAAGGLAGWVEFLLLRRALDRRIGPTRLPAGLTPRLWAAALVAAAAGWGVLLLLDGKAGPVLTAVAVVLGFGALYLGSTLVLGVPLARELARRVLRRP